MQVSLLVAILYLLLAVLRLGFLCNLLSRPIISAFLTAGALIISSSQVRVSASPRLLVLLQLGDKTALLQDGGDMLFCGCCVLWLGV
jgi:MFS superfamily sulfate permease-like transporter